MVPKYRLNVGYNVFCVQIGVFLKVLGKNIGLLNAEFPQGAAILRFEFVEVEVFVNVLLNGVFTEKENVSNLFEIPSIIRKQHSLDAIANALISLQSVLSLQIFSLLSGKKSFHD